MILIAIPQIAMPPMKHGVPLNETRRTHARNSSVPLSPPVQTIDVTPLSGGILHRSTQSTLAARPGAVQAAKRQHLV